MTSLTLRSAVPSIVAVRWSSWQPRWAVRMACVSLASVAAAQDLEPRRWTHLPVGTDIAAVHYAWSAGSLDFDPVLRIDDAEVELHTLALGYTRYFALGDRTARIDLLLPLQSGDWDGTVDGAPRSVGRDGLGDPAVRVSMNLVGAPALSGAQLSDYRRTHGATTSAGAALELRLPLGEYDEDKLINLGQDRFVLGTQLGVLRTRAEWSYELTGTLFLYGDNDDFFGGSELEQDPLYAVQAHVVRTFGTAWWLSAGAGYSWAGESTIDGVPEDDDKSNVLWGGSFGFRLAGSQSVRLAYARNDTQTDVGSDTDALFVGWSIRF